MLLIEYVCIIILLFNIVGVGYISGIAIVKRKQKPVIAGKTNLSAKNEPVRQEIKKVPSDLDDLGLDDLGLDDEPSATTPEKKPSAVLNKDKSNKIDFSDLDNLDLDDID